MSVSLILSLILLVSCSASRSSIDSSHPATTLPVAAPMTTDSAGSSADQVRAAVVRVFCRATALGGTGFLHRSGHVITAAHVVEGCPHAELRIITAETIEAAVSSVRSDVALDLALVEPRPSLSGTPLKIAGASSPKLGSFLITWGYPGGYTGADPLLSAGYLSGIQEFRPTGGPVIRRWVVNAAFNGGNSGGPLISVDDGAVIGVVSSKLAPLPAHIGVILDHLSHQKTGITSEATMPDGRKITVTEGQLVGEVLKYLRSQVQLVIGYAVTTADLQSFLKANGVQP
jgi:S1-C subfamily serine protease